MITNSRLYVTNIRRLHCPSCGGVVEKEYDLVGNSFKHVAINVNGFSLDCYVCDGCAKKIGDHVKEMCGPIAKKIIDMIVEVRSGRQAVEGSGASVCGEAGGGEGSGDWQGPRERP